MSTSNSAAGIAWDLGDLYHNADDAALEKDLAQALKRARAFEKKYRGRIERLGPTRAKFLLSAIVDLESLYEQMDRPLVYAMLLHSSKSDDPKYGALLARTQEQRTEINKHLIFFDLEWVKVPKSTARKLVKKSSLAKYRHWLEQKRVWKPYYLSEPEEKILDAKSLTGKSAFGRLFEETTASMKCPFTQGGVTTELSVQEILAKLYDPDRPVRKAAAEGLSIGLQNQNRLLTFIFNTIVFDHQTDCQLRNYPDVMAARNLANEIDGKVVEALMAATEKHYSLVQRYYRLKGKLLKIDKLYDYDRYAPLSGEMPKCDWPTARSIVQESYDAFSSQAGGIVAEFFEKRWIDAELRPGKRGGAFSSSAVPSAHPYILMNFTERLRDVMTLAHELGHGVHQYLARGQGYLQCDTPLTTAETASVFGEMLTFRRLLERYPEQRLAMLCGKIEDAFATVFRQVVLTRFEQTLHAARQGQGELSADAINQLWMKANQAMFGEVVEFTPGYATWWSYIGHFIRSPFYCYAYSFGELLVLALYQKYKDEGESFVPKYLELLSSGGSAAPHVLLAELGVDVTDPGFWELGLHLLGEMVAEAERLASV
ncbi:MAG: M3 family oligoendopeptidase [Planctomycetes bacterium]|nr:M3 family oligoendopeptidase [Planctomycetota bacterium]